MFGWKIWNPENLNLAKKIRKSPPLLSQNIQGYPRKIFYLSSCFCTIYCSVCSSLPAFSPSIEGDANRLRSLLQFTKTGWWSEYYDQPLMQYWKFTTLLGSNFYWEIYNASAQQIFNRSQSEISINQLCGFNVKYYRTFIIWTITHWIIIRNNDIYRVLY